MMNDSLFASEVRRGDNLAFQLGHLSGDLKYTIAAGQARGITVTDRAAFESWVAERIALAESEAKRLYPRL